MPAAPFIGLDDLDAIPPERLVLLDVRHFYGSESQAARFAASHIPRSQFVELRTDLAGPRGPETGRNPLPEPAAIERSLRAWGVRADSQVVVVADAGAPAVGRAWWVLTWAGVPGVRILDGGIQAWTAAGRPLVAEVVEPVPGDFVVTPGALVEIGPEESVAFAAAGQLVDARPAKDFVLDPADELTGHIPGAVSLPYSELVDADGRLRDGGELRALLAARGVDADAPIGLYCGGGVAAAFEAAALGGLGLDTSLYVGSWTQWITDPERPRA